jgi:hypothetical protein
MFKRIAVLLAVSVWGVCNGADIAKTKDAEILEAKVYPVDFQKGSYYLAGRFPGALVFTLSGDKKRLKEPVLEFDLPKNFEFLGGSAMWPKKISADKWKWENDRIQKSRITRNGQSYDRYKINLNRAMIRRLGERHNLYRVYLRSASGIEGESGTAFWRFSDGGWQGKEQQFKLNTIKEIVYPRQKMKKFRIMIANLRGTTNSIPEVSDSYLNYWPRLAEKPLTYAWTWTWGWDNYDDAMRKRILSLYEVGIIISYFYGTPVRGLPDWLAQSKAAGKTGIRIVEKLPPWMAGAVICPEYLGNDPKRLCWDDFFPWALRRTYMKHLAKPAFIDWDLEPGAMPVCFCETCRKKFSSMLKLEKILSEAEIKKKYVDQWFDFRVKQHAANIEKFGESVKKNFPGTAAVLCSSPVQTDGGLARWCAVDCRLADGKIDLFRNMPYYEGIRFYRNIEYNNKILKTPAFPLIDPSENMEMYYRRYTPQGVLMNMLATAALGCKGIGFWPDDSFDGRYLSKIAEGVRLIARGEDYYSSAREDATISIQPLNTSQKTFVDNGVKFNLTFPDLKANLEKTVHRSNDNYLLTVFNYDDKNDALIKILPIEGGKYYIREINRDLLLSDADSRKGFLAEVPKKSVRLFELRKTAFSGGEKLSQSILEKKLKDFKSKARDIDAFSTISKKDAEISWGVLRPEKIPMMKITRGKYSIYVDPANSANIAGWQKKGQPSSDILWRYSRGFLGDIRLLPLDLSKTAKCQYKLDKIYVKAGNPVVEFSYEVPQPDTADPHPYRYAGLFIRKLISLEDEGRTLRIKYELINKNISRKPMQVGCMFRNYPKLKGKVVISSGPNRVSAGSPVNNAWFKRDRKNSEFFMEEAGEWLGGAISATASDGKHTEELIFIPDPQIIGWYSWRDRVHGVTVEPVSKEVSIDYGKKWQTELTIKRQ